MFGGIPEKEVSNEMHEGEVLEQLFGKRLHRVRKPVNWFSFQFNHNWSLFTANFNGDVGTKKSSGALNIFHGINDIVNTTCDDENIKVLLCVGSSAAGMYMYSRELDKGKCAWSGVKSEAFDFGNAGQKSMILSTMVFVRSLEEWVEKTAKHVKILEVHVKADLSTDFDSAIRKHAKERQLQIFEEVVKGDIELYFDGRNVKIPLHGPGNYIGCIIFDNFFTVLMSEKWSSAKLGDVTCLLVRHAGANLGMLEMGEHVHSYIRILLEGSILKILYSFIVRELNLTSGIINFFNVSIKISFVTTWINTIIRHLRKSNDELINEAAWVVVYEEFFLSCGSVTIERFGKNISGGVTCDCFALWGIFLQKLHSRIINIYVGFHNLEFWYVDYGIVESTMFHVALIKKDDLLYMVGVSIRIITNHRFFTNAREFGKLDYMSMYASALIATIHKSLRNAGKSIKWYCILIDTSNRAGAFSLIEFDYLITENKLDKHAELLEVFNTCIERENEAYGDLNMGNLKPVNILQRTLYFMPARAGNRHDIRHVWRTGEWLQGPCVNYLYMTFGYSKGDIVQLFIIGFGSSTLLFGIIVRSLADKQAIDRQWLSLTFSKAIFLRNRLAAITSGLFGNLLVDTIGLGGIALFDTAACFLVIGMAIVMSSWTQNCGDFSKSKDLLTKFRGATLAITFNEKISLKGAIQPLCEGSMYTFVFFWTSALNPNEEEISPGFIFATFNVGINVRKLIYISPNNSFIT